MKCINLNPIKVPVPPPAPTFETVLNTSSAHTENHTRTARILKNQHSRPGYSALEHLQEACLQFLCHQWVRSFSTPGTHSHVVKAWLCRTVIYEELLLSFCGFWGFSTCVWSHGGTCPCARPWWKPWTWALGRLLFPGWDTLHVLSDPHQGVTRVACTWLHRHLTHLSPLLLYIRLL